MLTGEEDALRGEGSYPSGHALRGQACALVMAQIAPERADTIFYRAYIYAQSRVIAGAHWQSDVDASRNGASIGFCALQGCPAFIEQMKKAKEARFIEEGLLVQARDRAEEVLRDMIAAVCGSDVTVKFEHRYN